jgi:hypothetical protein
LKEDIMPQISLYIDEKTLKKVENAAQRQHVSISKWVAEQIKTKVEPIYPINFESLFGSISDDTFIEPKEVSFGSDAEREGF